MSKQVLEQARDALHHMCETCSAGPESGYDHSIVADALEALDKALEDPIEKQLNESVEERLQRVENGLRWLGWIRDQHFSGGDNPVDFPKTDKTTGYTGRAGT